ncbi:MAG TPA: hypothetical protein V6D29_06200 [Leptolyngbyaceae cyanobacterium]
MDSQTPISLSPVTLAALDTIRGSRPWLTQEETLTRLIWAVSGMICSNQAKPDDTGLALVVQTLSLVMDKAGEWAPKEEG